MLPRIATMQGERFGMGFPGRAAALALADAPAQGELVADPRGPKPRRGARTTFVEGDNLEVLKLLAGKVRANAIYIDPPYNRGRDFVYRGIYGAAKRGRAKTDDPRDDEARRSAPWLAMLLPRLLAARALLHDDGVVFVSIDDNEVHHLRVLLDEVFGRESFIAQIIVVSNRGGRDYLRVAITHEYVLCYGRTPTASIRELPRGLALPLSDARGPYELRELRNRNPRFTPANRPNLHYPIWIDTKKVDAAGCHPVALARSRGAIEVVPKNKVGAASVWRWGQPKLRAAIVAGDPEASEVVAKQRKDGGYNIYEKHRKQTTKPRALWDDASLRSEQGSIELRAQLGLALFDHPKPLELVRRCVEIGCPPDGLVLDFFAGSGTTALAVAEQNRRDGGTRQCVLVQWPEPIPASSIAAQHGYADVAAIARARVVDALGTDVRCLLHRSP
ncbi:MAG TPA: site-specific DNA-methyltransferase [Nannocystaceae bacterium]|nr:site-specific DNA-methyltransferase [Nannocystaceae bacterium]